MLNSRCVEQVVNVAVIGQEDADIETVAAVSAESSQPHHNRPLIGDVRLPERPVANGAMDAAGLLKPFVGHGR
jgi:hypothetical protein